MPQGIETDSGKPSELLGGETPKDKSRIEEIQEEISSIVQQISPRYLAYAQNYLKHGNKSRAARAAGYKESTLKGNAGRPLKNRLVLRYVSLSKELSALQSAVSDDWFLNELKELYGRYKGDNTRAPQAVRCLEMLGEYLGYIGKGAHGKPGTDEGFVRMPPPPESVEEWRREMAELGYIKDSPTIMVDEDDTDEFAGLPGGAMGEDN